MHLPFSKYSELYRLDGRTVRAAAPPDFCAPNFVAPTDGDTPRIVSQAPNLTVQKQILYHQIMVLQLLLVGCSISLGSDAELRELVVLRTIIISIQSLKHATRIEKLGAIRNHDRFYHLSKVVPELLSHRRGSGVLISWHRPQSRDL